MLEYVPGDLSALSEWRKNTPYKFDAAAPENVGVGALLRAQEDIEAYAELRSQKKKLMYGALAGGAVVVGGVSAVLALRASGALM